MTAAGTGRAMRALPFPVDPVRAARALAALASEGCVPGAGSWFWLDGERPAPGESAVSYLGLASETRIARAGGEREFLEQLGVHDGAPLRSGFHGGWIVALGYEFGAALLRAGAPGAAGGDAGTAGEEPAFALRVGVVLAIHHDEGRAELRGDSEAVLDAWMERFAAALSAEAREHPGANAKADGSPDAPARTPAWRLPDDAYRARVEACRDAIHDGDAYVLCLTDTAEVDLAGGPAVDPLELFLGMRDAGGPATRGGVIVAGERALVSASPERFLSAYPLDRGGDGIDRGGGRGLGIATHPIKGTRMRGGDPARDAELAAELRADPKERAENLMIVDLMRNDLSRVCAVGTVAVDGFLRVESHPHVHQLVSTVRGVLAEGADIRDAIACCFPGGSMTGAPKRSSVDILAGLEPGPRGLYSGCFGWIDDGGAAELAMTIRSVELRGIGGASPRALVGAGGGVTADSDPDRELAEKHLKARPLLAVLARPATR